MDKGGNQAWRTFFDDHPLTKAHARTWDECTIAERYGGEVGEEWRDRLTAAVEGKEYVPVERKKTNKKTDDETQARTKPNDGTERSPSPASGRKAQNEAYFARLGAQNASRSTTLLPNQGGKYTGFGSDPTASSSREGNNSNTAGMPGINDFQKDPVAALTKGFGWFSSAVGKGAKTVNDNWVQPAAQKVFI